MAYTKYSLTPSSNTAAPPDGAPEGMLPSAVNDTMRDMMSQIRDCGDGIRGGTYTMTAPVITGGSINGTTTITTSGAISYTGTLTGGTGVVNLGSGQFYKDASGQVGIGTNTPTRTLDVLGTQSFRDVTGAKQLLIANDTTLVRLFSRNASDNSDIPMGFYTGATERMRVDSSGNLLVGTTTTAPPDKGFTVIPAAGASYINVGHINGTASGTSYATFAYNSGFIGSISQNGTTAVAYNTSSDYRLKENIAPMTGALDTVQKLKPVTYKWKSDGSDGQGFIAHELAEVVPDCVTGEKDAVDAEGKPVYQGIDTSFLVATLVSAIQELKAEIDLLKGK